MLPPREARERDTATLAEFTARIEKVRWWSPRWLRWFLTESPKPPSLYQSGEAASDQDTLRIQAQRWLEKEPKIGKRS